MTIKRKQISNIFLFVLVFFIVTLNISDISANPSPQIKTIKITKSGEWTWPDKSKIMNAKAGVTVLKEYGREKLKIHEEPKLKIFDKCPSNIMLKTMNEQTPVNEYSRSDGDLKFMINRELLDYELGTPTSSLSFKVEPSIAANDEHILITGNRFSSISNDQGASFSYLDVSKTFWVNKGDSDFSVDEFITPLTIEKLCKAINDDNYNISLNAPINTVDWLNELLKVPNFYDILHAKKPNTRFSKSITDYVDKTNTYRNKDFSQLNDEEQTNIKWLNRFILEETYPQETPKSIEAFIGDQVAIYSNKQKCFIWAQLWNEGQNDVPTYFVRLIVAKRLRAGELYAIYNFKPSIFDQERWKNLSFDFPDLAVCQNSLYMSISIMESPVKGKDQSLVMRIPLDKIANYQSDFDAEYCTIDGYCPRLTQGESETMFFATLDYNDWDKNNKWDKIRIYEWKCDKQKIVVTDLDINEWGDAYESIGPDGEPWLGSMGANITAAWISPDVNRTKTLGFAWTAGSDDSHPYPHIRVAFIKPNEKGKYEVFAQPHIWNASFAFAYPSICLNEKGQTGISLFFGGNILYPSHAVGIYDTKDDKWKLYWTAVGTDSPYDNKWGDYLTIRPHPTKNNAWITSGFTLNGGSRTKDLSIRFIQFESN